MKMKKLLISTKPLKSASDWTALFLRVGFGIIMMGHGWSKIQNFDQYSQKFMNFLGLGSSVSLSLVIFAEFVCSILLVVGLFTRLATIPLIFTTLMIMNVHDWDVIWQSDHELVLALFLAYIVILINGPGKYSLDNALSK